MKQFTCPKCKLSFTGDEQVINGKFTIVCPSCGKWDSSRDEEAIMKRWVKKQCFGCEFYQFDEGGGKLRKSRTCKAYAKMEIPEREKILIARGECIRFRKKMEATKE